MKVIVLCRRGQVSTNLDAWQQGHECYAVTDVNDLPLSLSPGEWTLIIRDKWLHDDQVVRGLQVLAAAPDITMVDPRGLLGSSEYGEMRRELHPAVRPNTGSLTSRRFAKAPRKPANHDRDRNWT